MPKLYVLSGPDVGKSFEVASGALVGRDPECAVRLRDPSVSRHHARVEESERGWSIVDTQSRNGIHLDGQRVPVAVLEDGAEFTLGEVLFRFRSEVALPAAPAIVHPAPAPSVPDEDAEIVLEGDWDEASSAPIAQTTIAPRPLPAPESPPRESAAARSSAALPAARTAPAAGGTHVGVAHRAGGTATSSKPVLQYQRVVDRPGFFNADMSQQPLGLKLLLWLAALLVFAGVFWFAFKGTAFLKGKAQHGSIDAQAEENG
jgi:predicted component of type VI protein secretion system